MITSLYENNFPMRFGIILYSSKFIENIETSGGDLSASSVMDDGQTKEDISNLVFASDTFSFFLRVFILLFGVMISYMSAMSLRFS